MVETVTEDTSTQLFFILMEKHAIIDEDCRCVDLYIAPKLVVVVILAGIGALLGVAIALVS